MMPELLQPAIKAAEKTPFFMNGADDRVADTRTVAIAIALRCEIKVGDRDFSCALNLHEVALYRRFYESKGGGSIRVSAGWPPALARTRKLAQAELHEEVKRLQKTCIVPREGMPPRDVFGELFGSEPAAALERFARTMKRQSDAWIEIVKEARGRLVVGSDVHPLVAESMAYDLITEKDIDRVINMANPLAEGAGQILLPEVRLEDISASAIATKPAATKPAVDLDAMKRQVEGGDDLDVIMDGLMARAGLSQAQALQVAAKIDDAKDHALVSDAELAAIVGADKVPAIRAALK